VLFGFVIFGDAPSLWTLAGAAAIVAASLYIMHRELLRGRGKT
jgi:drug/metabolite transporter (DMT)-like permease